MLTSEQISKATIRKSFGYVRIIETGFNLYVINGNEVISKHRKYTAAIVKFNQLTKQSAPAGTKG
jgi:hypothetical protein